jgi:hypothetical protein
VAANPGESLPKRRICCTIDRIRLQKPMKTMSFVRFHFYFYFSYSNPMAVEKR